MRGWNREVLVYCTIAAVLLLVGAAVAFLARRSGAVDLRIVAIPIVLGWFLAAGWAIDALLRSTRHARAR